MEGTHVMTYTDQFLVGLQHFIIWARWLLFAALILVVADLKFGVQKARHLRETVRKSRAVRRTMQKMSDYIIWIILAYTFGKAFIPFDFELLPFIILLVIYGIEIESCFQNYFITRGKNIKVNIFKLFSKKTDILEIENDEQTESKKPE